MCIVLLTTAHPDYALIVLDNRDEFILRPTSRPHWWSPAHPTPSPTPPPQAGPPPADRDHPRQQEILSSRDLQRAERGTWLGVTKAGHFAVLTNYREDSSHDAAHPVHGQRSRGGMVTAWLTADPAEPTAGFVARMLEGGGCKHVGGFSLICGKLRRRQQRQQRQRRESERELQPLAVMSNRDDTVAQVPWIAGRRGEVYGLSNTSYDDPVPWPKLEEGKRALRETVAAAAAAAYPEPRLREALFAILDRDTLPSNPDMSFEEHISLLKESIFIPPIGDEDHREAMRAAAASGARAEAWDDEAARLLACEERPDEQVTGFMTGMYGTQRQTVLLVDWDGNATYTERALWDANGNPIPRGQGDVTFRFHIDGWDEEDEKEEEEEQEQKQEQKQEQGGEAKVLQNGVQMKKEVEVIS